jgi:hypothetical protein
MPVRKGRKPKPSKGKMPRENPAPPLPSKRWSPLGRLVEIGLAIATLIGAPAAVVAFWPRLTVTASGPFDESNAYSETFTVTNTGFLAFEDVNVGIGFCAIEMETRGSLFLRLTIAIETFRTF